MAGLGALRPVGPGGLPGGALKGGFKGGGKRGRFPQGNGPLERLASTLEDREYREQWNEHLAFKKEEEKEKREEKERNVAERKHDYEEYQKRADEQAARHNKEMKEALHELKQQNEERDRERKREDGERRARKNEEARQREEERKRAKEEERIAELQRKLEESEAERRHLEKQKVHQAIVPRGGPPAPYGRLRKRTKEPPSGDEDEQDEDAGDWRGNFQKMKRPRQQRVVAPIDVNEWVSWTANKQAAGKIQKQLGIKSLKASAMVGLDLLETAALIAPMYTEANLKKVHNTITGTNPKARWSREDIAVHFLSKIVGSP